MSVDRARKDAAEQVRLELAMIWASRDAGRLHEATEYERKLADRFAVLTSELETAQRGRAQAERECDQAWTEYTILASRTDREGGKMSDARLIVSPATFSSGGGMIPGLVDGDLYDANEQFVRSFSDLTTSQARKVAAENDAVIVANGKVVWPRV